MAFTLSLDALFTAHGYYRNPSRRHYIQRVDPDDSGARSYHVHDDGRVEYEYLTICHQGRHEVADISTPEGIATLLGELVTAVADDAAERGTSDAEARGRLDAQNTFEQGYWEYLDGRDSDFDPTFYDRDGYLIPRD